MSTLAFGEMFYFLENSLFKEYTGGENGIAGVPPPEIALGFVTINISIGWPMDWFVAIFFFLGYVISRRIVPSPFGSVLTAISVNPKRAMSSAKRRDGKECVRTCRFRSEPVNLKIK